MEAIRSLLRPWRTADAADVTPEDDGLPFVPLGMPAARPFTLAGEETVFLVHVTALPSFRPARFREAGVDIDQTATFEGHRTWGFTRSELEKLMQELDLYVALRKGSTRPNAEWVTLAHTPGLDDDVLDGGEIVRMLEQRFEVTDSARDRTSHSASMFYLVSRALSPVVQRKILLDVPHARCREHDERGAFQIYIWSTPDVSASRDRSPPRRIWGIEVDNDDDAFRPRPGSLGIQIRDEDYVVAELFPNALYVHHDLVHSGTTDERAIMKLLCGKVSSYLVDPAKMQGTLDEIKAAWDARQSELFASLVTQGIPARQSRKNHELDLARKARGEAKRAYVEAERKVFRLEQASLGREVVAERFAAEIAKLQRGGVAFVQGVTFDPSDDGSVLRVQTKEIIATDPKDGTQYMLGCYEIELHLGDGHVNFFNKERLVDGCHGPHISTDGSACLGSIDEDITAYIANFEVEAAVVLAIAFLQNPNTSDGEGKRVYGYPVVKRGQKETEDEAE